MATRLQVLAVEWAQHYPTARRQHTRTRLRKVVYDRLFNVAKALFAFALEILADRAAQALLYNVIRVSKSKIEPTGELPTYS